MKKKKKKDKLTCNISRKLKHIKDEEKITYFMIGFENFNEFVEFY
jgi:hypothetical protein